MILVLHCVVSVQISDIDKPDDFGVTPLMLVTQRKNTKLTMMLIG